MSGAGTTTIAIRVNGHDRTVPAGLTVRELIAHLGLDPGVGRIAVERNRVIVPRAAHHETLVAAGDVFELVTFVGGG